MATAEPRAQHIRHCLLFLYDQGMTSNDAWRQIKKTYGARSMSKTQCGRWFAKFDTGDRLLYRLKQTNDTMNIPTPLHPNPTALPPRSRRVKQEDDFDVLFIKEEPDIICVKEEIEII